jgi:hypothetical protein
MVGSTPCRAAPRMLKTSPSSQTMMNCSERPSALPQRRFSTIWGEKTTTQQAIEMELAAGSARQSTCWRGNTQAAQQRNSPTDSRYGLGIEG